MKRDNSSNIVGNKLYITTTRKKRKKEKIVNTDFQKITAKQIAEENGVEYIPKAIDYSFVTDIPRINKCFAAEGKYILLYPPNDGRPTCPIEWLTKIGGGDTKIIDNKKSYNSITNLSDILLQMVRLYMKYIDEDVFINPFSFAIKLEDEVCENYIGRASLVLTDDSIQNNKISPEDRRKRKKYFFNKFLDHYIGWNFGLAVENNSQLEKELNELNRLVISKGLRKHAGSGYEVFCTKYVKHYLMPTKI